MRTSNKKLNIRIAGTTSWLLAWILGSIPNAALSKANQTNQAGKTAARSIEEVIVSARKRDETLIDIPLSVSALSGDKFDQYDIEDMADVAEMVPGFYVDTSTIGVRISMRGLGDMVIGPAFEQSIGLSIDGIYYGRMRWFEVGTFDVEQINVLRGPQGVYFGKNVTSGLVDIKSRAPGNNWEVNGSVGYETEIGKKMGEIGVGGPVTDWLGVRVAVQARDEDGFIDNLSTGDKEQRLEQQLGRFSVDIDPLDNLSIELRFQDVKSDRFGQTSQLAECTSLFRDALSLSGSLDNCRLDDERTAGKGIDGGFVKFGEEYTKNDSESQALSVQWRVGGYDLSYSFGHWVQRVELTLDPDFSDLQALGIEFPETYKQFSHEFRIVSPAIGPLEILLGAYIDHGDLDTEQNTDDNLAAFGSFNTTPGSSYKRMKQKMESQAVFTEIRINLSDTMRLMLGGRYTEETRKADLLQELGSLGNPFDNDPAATAVFNNLLRWTEIRYRDKRKSDNFSPSVVFQWDFSSTGRTYLSYKEAFKSGGFDSQVDRQEVDGTVEDFEFDDELVESYELGVKSTLLDNSVSASVALFNTEYRNLQVQTFDGFVGVDTLNAAASTNRGVEAELSWRASQSLSITASGAYIDASYDKFDVAPCYAGQTGSTGCIGGKQDLGGKTLPLAPEYSGALSIDWNRPAFQTLLLAAGLNINYRDEVVLNLAQDPNAHSDSVTQINCYFSLADIDQQYVFTVSAKNITDEEYANGFIEMPLYVGSYILFRGEPRTIQAKMSVYF